MAGTVCLQGGAEFGPACRGMDADLVAFAGGGLVVVVPLAARPGADYASAGENGVRHFASLGATATVAPDYRREPGAAVAAVAGAGLVVLPGGSPSALRSSVFGTPMGDALAAVLGRGRVVMGASAGAMVLTEWMVLPDAGGAVVPGLNHVPGVLVLPHYTGGRPRMTAPEGVDLLGLPECSGVIVRGEEIVAVGARPAIRIGADGEERAL